MNRSDTLAGIGALIVMLGILCLGIAVVAALESYPTSFVISHVGLPAWWAIATGQAFGVASSLCHDGEHRSSLTWRVTNLAVCLIVAIASTLWVLS
jgi:hypothetical protein